MNNKIALTISPKDRLYGEYKHLCDNKIKNPNRIIFNDDSEIIVRALNRCSNEYVVYPESDDTGRLHYHGLITLNNKTNWTRTTLPKLKTLGFICAKTKVNDGWSEYCTKNWNYTKTVLELEEPIVYRKLKRGHRPSTRKYIEINQMAKKNIFDYLY